MRTCRDGCVWGDSHRAQLLALVEQVPAAIGAFGADGSELVANSRYRSLVAQGLAAGAPTNAPEPDEREVRVDDEDYVAMRFPIGDEGSAVPVGYGEVLLDVSPSRSRTVRTAMMELEQLKSDLVTTVSHELRTPLSSILGYCELLSDGEFVELDPAARQMVDVISRNSRRLSGLLNDLLLLAHLDGPRAATDSWGRVGLGGLARTVVGLVTPQVTTAGHAVALDPLPDGEVWVDGDATQLQHALINLVTNAVKFSLEAGTIRLRVAVEDAQALLEVIDNGVGIDPEDLPRLVDRFYRTSAARGAQIQGAGIGLSVVHAVAERHEGHLEVSSRPGEGTVARLRLPLVTAPAQDPAPTRDGAPG